ncbi:DoxX family protein [Paenibacillus oryzae]|jgi:thiosulfate dehydrogenase [quinone] large subunit|nr:DoxX family protein [Paenibacillus oryzae]
MMKFWRENVWAAGFAAFIRIFLGYQWLSSGLPKLTGATPFTAEGFLNNVITNPVMNKATGEPLYPLFNSFVEHVALPNIKIINILVPWGEVLIGAGLILGTLTLTAAFFGLVMNFMFMFAGTVSSNPWLLLLGFIVVLAGANAGRFGLDRYVLPWLGKKTGGKLFRRAEAGPAFRVIK